MRLSSIVRMLAFAVATCSTSAHAGDVVGYPANWRLQDYIDNLTVVVWYTGAPGCTNGRLTAKGWTQEEYNRLWSTILSAKLANQQVGIYYDGSGDACIINSFYIGG